MTTMFCRLPIFRFLGFSALLLAIAPGCGTTRDKLATEQLLLSDAVDRAVARIDFSPLKGEKVYLDTSYLKEVKSAGFVNADYIISSLRQQMASSGCLLQENREDAVYIAEARVGVLGSDAHDVNYGIPGSNGITAAATLVANAAPLPSLPEISFARKTDDSAATKVAVFAYDRVTREPVWQSGLSVARSRAQARWLLGAGPFQSGTIYEGTQFAGRKLGASSLKGATPEPPPPGEQQYRSFAVYGSRLREKLGRGTSSEVIASQGGSAAAPTDAPASTDTAAGDSPTEANTSGQKPADDAAVTGTVQQADHRQEVVEPATAASQPAAATAPSNESAATR
jgi:hypothetical protein